MVQWVRSHSPDFFGEFSGRPGELAAHGRRKVNQLDSTSLQTDLCQNLLGVFNSPAGVEITFQVMAVALQSTCYHNAIGAILESPQQVQYVEPAGTG